MVELEPAEITGAVFGVGTKQFADVSVSPLVFVFVKDTEYILGPQIS